MHAKSFFLNFSFSCKMGKMEKWIITDGLLGRPTRWPQVLSRTTNRSRTDDWLIQGRFHPEKAEESALVKDKDLLGDKAESRSSALEMMEPVMVPRPMESFSLTSEAATEAIAEVNVAVEAKEYDPYIDEALELEG